MMKSILKYVRNAARPHKRGHRPCKEAIEHNTRLLNRVGPSCGIGILQLPEEILLRIFSYIRQDWNEQVPTAPPFFWFGANADDLDTIKSIRLTCQCFCRISSQFLLEQVNVSLSLESVARLEEIARHIGIRSGVQAVRFSVSSYSARLAGDLQCFTKFASDKLQGISGMAEAHVSGEFFTYSHGEKKTWKRVLKTSNRTRRSLDAIGTRKEDKGDAQTLQDIHAIKQGFEQYKRRYEEQNRILKDGTFFSRVSLAIAAMPNVRWILLKDGRPHMHQNADANAELLENTAKFVRETLLHPFTWEEEVRLLDEVPPVELLTQLPLGLSNAGVRLHGIKFDLIAAPGTFTLAQLDHDGLCNLETAMKSLRYMVFGAYSTIPSSATATTRTIGVESFISALTRGKSLQILVLNFSFIPEEQDGRVLGLDATTSIGPLLSSRPYPRLEKLKLTACAFHQSELELLLSTINGQIGIEFAYVRLLSGTWADTMDILRLKSDDSSKVNNLLGAECEDISDENFVYLFNILRRPYRMPSRATQYISGRPISNPFREV
ncbi:hypothetical protein BX600DRAFT_157062 [Xylariales sp. PMI_506]|nr:hypothetical protein BX600DRAFT_157062 [Xylariales sp. PMI_506]